MISCLITGCDLVDNSFPPRWCHGDLYRMDKGPFIFNACLTRAAWEGGPEGETAWQYEDFPGEGAKVLNIPALGIEDCFERRGVIVIPFALGTYNRTAREYVK